MAAGRFELRTLSPGSYLLRAHLSGFLASQGKTIEVRPSSRASSSIAMRRAPSTATSSTSPVLPPTVVLAAGVGLPAAATEPPSAQPNACRRGRRHEPRRLPTTITARPPGASGITAGASCRMRPGLAVHRRRGIAGAGHVGALRCNRCGQSLSGATGREPFRRHSIFRPAQSPDDQLLRQPAAAVQRQQLCPQCGLHLGRRAGRQRGRLGGSGGAVAGRHLVVGGCGCLLDTRPRTPSLRHRSLVRDAALRWRQSRRAARRDRRQPERRRDVRVRHLHHHAGDRPDLSAGDTRATTISMARR